MQQLRNLTIVCQMMAQIRDLRNLGSSSGATHVPDEAFSISESQNIAALRFWLPRDTLNGKRTAENVFF